MAFSAVDADGPAQELFGGHRRVGPVERIAFHHQQADISAQTWPCNAPNHSMDEQPVGALIQNSVARVDLEKVETADEGLITRTNPRKNAGGHDANVGETAAATLGGNGWLRRRSGRASS